MLVALVPEPPPWQDLVTSGLAVVPIGLAIGFGNAVHRSAIYLYVLMAAIATAAGAVMYVAVWVVPIEVRPWGLATIVWTSLNVTWLALAEWRHRDYSLCVAAIATAGVLVFAIIEFAGVDGRVVIAAQAWVLGSLLLVWNRERVVGVIGWQRAWKLFQWNPESSDKRARSFYTGAILDAQQRHQLARAGMAQVGLARCVHKNGNRRRALELLREAAETLDDSKSAWSAIAYAQLAQWMLTASGRDLGEAEDLAGMALRAASKLARAQRIRAWALVVRAVSRLGRDDRAGARADADSAARLLRRHKDARLDPTVRQLEARLNLDGDGATASD
jgi:hypothetical protein